MNEETKQSDPFDGTWAIVELMGHQKIAGKVSEETRLGTVLLRVDVPEIEGCGAFTRYFGGSAVYGITPTDEPTVMEFLQWHRPKPVQAYFPSSNSASRLYLDCTDDDEPDDAPF